MKRTELMLGAIVSVRGDEAKRLRVTGITKKKIQYIENKQPKYLRYSQLLPILLDERMLQGLGFEKRQMTFGKSIVTDWILEIHSKKNPEEFYIITAQTDDELGVNKYRAIHIDDSRRMNAGFGYVKDIHELQALIQTTTKLCLDTTKIL